MLPYAPPPRKNIAPRVVELTDGTRSAADIAGVLGVSLAYVRATANRQGVLHKLVRKQGVSLKVRLRQAEADRDAYKLENEKLRADIHFLNKALILVANSPERGSV